MDLAIHAKIITIVQYQTAITKLANQEFASKQTGLRVQVVVNANPVAAPAQCASRLQARFATMELNANQDAVVM